MAHHNYGDDNLMDLARAAGYISPVGREFVQAMTPTIGMAARAYKNVLFDNVKHGYDWFSDNVGSMVKPVSDFADQYIVGGRNYIPAVPRNAWGWYGIAKGLSHAYDRTVRAYTHYKKEANPRRYYGHQHLRVVYRPGVVSRATRKYVYRIMDYNRKYRYRPKRYSRVHKYQ